MKNRQGGKESDGSSWEVIDLMERSAMAIHLLRTDFRELCDLLKEMVIWNVSDESIAEHHNLNVLDVSHLRKILQDK